MRASVIGNYVGFPHKGVQYTPLRGFRDDCSMRAIVLMVTFSTKVSDSEGSHCVNLSAHVVWGWRTGQCARWRSLLPGYQQICHSRGKLCRCVGGNCHAGDEHNRTSVMRIQWVALQATWLGGAFEFRRQSAVPDCPRLFKKCLPFRQVSWQGGEGWHPYT
jgi:hypothetical protein